MHRLCASVSFININVVVYLRDDDDIQRLATNIMKNTTPKDSKSSDHFWEDFDVDWMKDAARIDELPKEGQIDVHGAYGRFCYKGYRHSLCHGWASGVTPWLSENVLGVKILEPGCKKIKVEPHLGDLEWAKGTYPTPYGEITVSHVKQADGSIETTVDAPEEIEVL